MQIFVIIFLISSFGCTFVHSIELKCDRLGTTNWKIIGSHYQCEILNQEIITDKFNRVVHSVTANHQNSKSNDDVKGINIYNSTVNFFPRGVEKYFKNLEGITITNSSLKEIRKSDLKPFAELRVLFLYRNQLEVIEANLFDNNPKLEGIYLYRNRISHVDAKALNKFVGKLRWLQFTNNICEISGSLDNIQVSNEIIAQIQASKCKDEEKLAAFNIKSEIEVLWDSINNLENTLVGKMNGRDSDLEGLIQSSRRQIEQNVKNLQQEIRNNNEEIKIKLKDMKADQLETGSAIQNISEQISVFKTKNSATNDQLKTMGKKQNEINAEILDIKNTIQTSLNEPKSAIQDLSEQISAVKSQTLDEIKKVKDELKTQKNEATSAVKNLENTLVGKIDSRISNLETLIEEEKFSRELKINEIITSIVESKSELQVIKSDQIETKSAIKDLSEQISVINNENLAIKNQLKTKDETQQAEILDIKNTIEAKFNETMSAIQDLSEQISAVKSQTLNEIKKVKDELKAQKNEATSAVKNLNDQNSEFKTTLNNVTMFLTEIQKRLNFAEELLGVDPSYHNKP